MLTNWNDQSEWLETDGLGGFASGTIGGIRCRRYHGLLLSALRPPTERFMLINGIEAHVTTPDGEYPITSQRYAGQVIHPEGFRLIESFDTHPWPIWRFRLPDTTLIEQEIFVRHGQPIVAITWRVVNPKTGTTLSVRPLISGRDYHALHHANANFRFDADHRGSCVRWRPYESLPTIMAQTNGRYEHAPLWYRDFLYQEEWLRGFDATEDLASPGAFHFDLSRGEAILILSARGDQPLPTTPGANADHLIRELRTLESRRRREFPSRLHRSADQYLVRRDSGKSIIAGYPWFADWGRDTFVSLRGLCLATGRFDDATQILTNWARHISQGMLPNRFPDRGEDPEFNSVDASLWYVIAVFELLRSAEEKDIFITEANRAALLKAVDAILAGYADGTRHGIRADTDGLLAAGVVGQQLTWMDARVDGREITPRIGKPVEVQALWINALSGASRLHSRWQHLYELARENFARKFWNAADGYLYDVVDVDHQPGKVDATFRPNQIFAVGGLPLNLLEMDQARRVVDAVGKQLLTPLGLRSLDPSDPQYRARYSGGPSERDSAYHQGTAWPWLIGAFAEAWVRARSNSPQARRDARRLFLDPLIEHLDSSGLNHMSEIADADSPHMPRGCPFQAWSLAEVLRLDQVVLAVEPKPSAAERHPTADASNEPVTTHSPIEAI